MKKSSFILTYFAFFTLCLFATTLASGQSRFGSSVKSKLEKIVDLKPGSTTVLQVMNRLSEQTGVKVFAAKYLEEHQFYLNMTHVSASHVLDLICELNNWRWIVSNDQDVFLTHLIQPRVDNMENFPAAFRTVYPKPWDTFLGLGTNMEELVDPEEMNKRKKSVPEVLDFGDPEFLKQVDEIRKNAISSLVSKSFYDRKNPNVNQSETDEKWFPFDKNRYRVGMNLPYTQWTDKEKASVLKSLLRLVLVNNRFSMPTYRDMIGGYMRPYFAHPEKGIIGFNGGFLSFGVMLPDANGILKPNFEAGTAVTDP